MAAACVMGAAASVALAQPGNPGPTEFVDMGSIGIGANVYQTATVDVGGHVWFKINLAATIDPTRNWLELDMSGPTTLTNPDLAVYDARANRIFVNNDSGGSCGTDTNSLAPALSIGGGSGLRLSRALGGTYNGGRISTGADSPSLGAGTYWVVVTASVGSFPDPNPTWGATPNSVLAGTVGLRVSTGTVAPTTWNEAQNSVDAGSLLDTAQVATGRGTLSNILCTYPVASRDMFKFRIRDGANFSATAAVSGFDGGQYQVRLFLFDSTGRGIAAINKTTANTDTTLTRPAGTPALPEGEYYLAISSNCGGFSTGGVDYGPAVPFTATDQVMWSFTSNNASIAPTAEGAASPLSYWGRQSDCQNPNGYFANITLVGAEYIDAGCPADVDDGSGTGTPDEAVTIEDLLYFLTRYEGGC